MNDRGLFGRMSGLIKEGNPLATHFSMFVTTISGQGTIEQQGEWLERAKNLQIFGTYAQVSGSISLYYVCEMCLLEMKPNESQCVNNVCLVNI